MGWHRGLKTRPPAHLLESLEVKIIRKIIADHQGVANYGD